MDTRQLAAFCAVVERKSFSQAAERLGVTQPAVSLQVRSLEKRLGRKLLDRSGRRVEPTEAGPARSTAARSGCSRSRSSCSRSSQAGEEGELGGTLEIGASTGPGGTVVPVLLCEFQRAEPRRRVSLSISDTQTVVERVADRELELGVVGAARRHRGVVFEPFFRDEVVLACPPGHRVRRPHDRRSTSCASEPLIVMQEGAGVRQVIEDELRRAGTRLRDLEPQLELGLQESARAPSPPATASRSSRAPRSRPISPRARSPPRASKGLEPAREISLVRSAGRSPTRAARGVPRRSRGSGSSDRPLGARRAPGPARRARDRAPVPRRERPLGRTSTCPRAAAGTRFRPTGSTTRPRRREGCDGLLVVGGGSAIDLTQGDLGRRPACRSSRCRRRTRAPSGRRPSASATRAALMRRTGAAPIRPGSSTSRS